MMKFFAIFAVLYPALLAAQPIRLHPRNPHYFLYRGKAVALVTSGEHYGSVMNLDFDYRRYLSTLAADGLNYTRIFGGSYREVPGKSFGIQRNNLAPTDSAFLAPWARDASGKFDLDRWDPRFFQRLRDFLAEADRRGIVVEITLFSSHYAEMQWRVSALNAANNVNHTDAIDWKKLHTLENGNLLTRQEQYTRKLVREANPFDNVIFEIQNEPWSDRPKLVDVINPYLQPPARDTYPNSVEIADENSIAWQARVMSWIRSEESSLPGKHMVAQNYCNFRFPVQQLPADVDLVNFHYAYPEAVLLNYGIGKALGYDETGFLGRGDDAYRRQAWNFMLSGGSAFDGLDYSFSVGHEDGTDTAPNGPGGGSPALRHQLRTLVEFLQKLPLVEMAPDAQTAKHAAGAYARVISKPGSLYAIYIDADGPTELTLNLPSGTYSGEWTNAFTGQVQALANFSHKGGDTVLHTPRFENGMALRLTRK
jgi:hypothetical protein